MDSIDLYSCKVPMLMSFSHASFTHKVSGGVLLSVRVGGITGWGEAAPRTYVTGESVTSIAKDMQTLDYHRLAKDFQLADFDGALELIDNIETYFRESQAPGPCTRCLLETALLDVLLKYHRVSYLELCQRLVGSAVHAEENLQYVLVLDRNQAGDIVKQISAGAHRGVKRLKLKVDADLAQAQHMIAELRRVLPQTEIALDVNEGWTAEQLLEAGTLLSKYDIACLEEPLPARSWDAMAQFRSRFGIPVMLDESFCSAEDLHAACAKQAFDVLNIRLSKCGGLMRALGFIKTAQAMGKSVYFGVHVGEVGPLWACQRALALVVKNRVGVEVGKQDQWFAQPTTSPPYEVDRQTHTARPPQGPGHGVVPSEYLRGYMQHVSNISQQTGHGQPAYADVL